jgi:hypothetical protein
MLCSLVTKRVELALIGVIRFEDIVAFRRYIPWGIE